MPISAAYYYNICLSRWSLEIRLAHVVLSACLLFKYEGVYIDICRRCRRKLSILIELWFLFYGWLVGKKVAYNLWARIFYFIYVCSSRSKNSDLEKGIGCMHLLDYASPGFDWSLLVYQLRVPIHSYYTRGRRTPHFIKYKRIDPRITLSDVG